MAALTPEDVANMALALLTEAPIDSLEDDDKSARLLRLHYDTTREAELEDRVWRFAILSAEVAGVEIAYGRHAFTLPGDCLRPLPPTFYDLPDGTGDYFDAEGDALILPWGGSRTIRYVGNMVDPGDWPAQFVEVVAAALAIKLAHPVTGKASMIEAAQAAYNRALTRARRNNALLLQGRPPAGWWSQARGDHRLPGDWRR